MILFRKEFTASFFFKLFKIIFPLGFALSQAMKALRESRGIALLYFRPLY